MVWNELVERQVMMRECMTCQKQEACRILDLMIEESGMHKQPQEWVIYDHEPAHCMAYIGIPKKIIKRDKKHRQWEEKEQRQIQKQITYQLGLQIKRGYDIMNIPYTREELVMIEEVKQLDYETMLRSFRHDKTDHQYHVGRVGMFFRSRMNILGEQMTEQERHDISEKVGW